MCFHVLFKNTVFVYFLVSKVKVLKIHVFYMFFIVLKIFVCILFVFSRFSLGTQKCLRLCTGIDGRSAAGAERRRVAGRGAGA